MSHSSHPPSKSVDDATATQAPAPAKDAAASDASTEGYIPQADGATYPINTGRPGAAFYTPYTHPPAGTVLKHMNEGKTTPKLFQPLTIRNVEFKNRIWVRRDGVGAG